MSQKFPTDEFDSVAPHGGRHRTRRTARDGVREFFRLMAASAAVGAIAIIGLKVADGSVQLNPADLISPSASTGTTVKSTPVTVLDGTARVGLASKVAHSLLDAGWNVLTADNLSATAEVKTTKVYIGSADLESASKTLLKTLGNYAVEVSGTYADPITIVLGSDFK